MSANILAFLFLPHLSSFLLRHSTYVNTFNININPVKEAQVLSLILQMSLNFFIPQAEQISIESLGFRCQNCFYFIGKVLECLNAAGQKKKISQFQGGPVGSLV